MSNKGLIMYYYLLLVIIDINEFYVYYVYYFSPNPDENVNNGVVTQLNIKLNKALIDQLNEPGHDVAYWDQNYYKPVNFQLENVKLYDADDEHTFKLSVDSLGEKLELDTLNNELEEGDNLQNDYYYHGRNKIDLSNIYNLSCGQEVTERSLCDELINSTNFYKDDNDHLLEGTALEDRAQEVYNLLMTRPNPELDSHAQSRFNYIYKIPYRPPRTDVRYSTIHRSNRNAKKLNFNERNIQSYNIWNHDNGNITYGGSDKRFVTNNVNFWIDIPNYIGIVQVEDLNHDIRHPDDVDLGKAVIDFKSLTLNSPLTFLGNTSGYDCYYLLYDISKREIYVEIVKNDDNEREKVKEIPPSYLLYKGRIRPYLGEINEVDLEPGENYVDLYSKDENELLTFINGYRTNLSNDGNSLDSVNGLSFDVYFFDTYDRMLYGFRYESGNLYSQENPQSNITLAPQYLDQMTDINYKPKLRKNEHVASLVELTSGKLVSTQIDDNHLDYESDGPDNVENEHKENVFKDKSRYINNSFIIRNNGTYPDIVGGVFNDMRFAPIVNSDYFQGDDNVIGFKNEFANDCVPLIVGHVYCIVVYTKQLMVNNKNTITKRFSTIMLHIDNDISESGLYVLYLSKSPEINVLYCEDITDQVNSYNEGKDVNQPLYMSVDLTLLAQNDRVINLTELGCKGIPQYVKKEGSSDVTIPGSLVQISNDSVTLESKARFLFDLRKSRVDFTDPNGDGKAILNSDGIFVINSHLVDILIPEKEGRRSFDGQYLFKRYFNDDDHDNSEYDNLVTIHLNENWIELLGSQFYFENFDTFYSSFDNRIDQLIPKPEPLEVNLFNDPEDSNMDVEDEDTNMADDRKIERKVKHNSKLVKKIDLNKFNVEYRTVRNKRSMDRDGTDDDDSEFEDAIDDYIDFDGDVDDYYDAIGEDIYIQDKTFNSSDNYTVTMVEVDVNEKIAYLAPKMKRILPPKNEEQNSP